MQRLRVLLAAAAITGFGVLALPGAANAEEPAGAPPVKHETECVVQAVESGATGAALDTKVEACAKAPNVLLPETNEIIWGAIGFLIVFGFLGKVGYPAIKKSMDARTERIRGDLAAADASKAEAASILSEYRAQLVDAKNEAGRIIEEARQQADALKRDQESRLQTELAEIRARATADMESAKTQAIADLRGEVASLAIGAAEVVVQRNLDRDTQSQLVENYINQVASRSN